jgi:hypothetical protein
LGLPTERQYTKFLTKADDVPRYHFRACPTYNSRVLDNENGSGRYRNWVEASNGRQSTAAAPGPLPAHSRNDKKCQQAADANVRDAKCHRAYGCQSAS